jgi:hypothetical protein
MKCIQDLGPAMFRKTARAGVRVDHRTHTIRKCTYLGKRLREKSDAPHFNVAQLLSASLLLR